MGKAIVSPKIVVVKSMLLTSRKIFGRIRSLMVEEKCKCKKGRKSVHT